jgi:hypothetical protein
MDEMNGAASMPEMDGMVNGEEKKMPMEGMEEEKVEGVEPETPAAM